MNPKILIVNYFYPPIINGGVQRTYNFKKYLSQMGFDVSFITTGSYGCLKDDPFQKVFRFSDVGYDYTHSVKHSRLLVFLFRFIRLFLVKTGILTDGKYYWKHEVIKHIEQSLNLKEYDIVIASYPTPANLEIGEVIHRKYGIPLVVDYRDGLMYEPFYEVKNSFPLYKRRMIALEKRMAKIASLQLTVNPEMNQYYSSKYPCVKSVMIPNGFDDEEIIDSEPIKLPKGINVVFTGAIGKSRRVYNNNELADFLGFLFDIGKDVNFVFVGDYKSEEIDILKKYKNVYVYEKTDRNRAIATQRIADALLLISGPQGGTSGKLYEYLFSQKPILNIGSHRGVADIIDGSHYGITCEPDEREMIERFIEDLKKGKLQFKSGELKKYTRRYQASILAEELKAIVRNE